MDKCTSEGIINVIRLNFTYLKQLTKFQRGVYDLDAKTLVSKLQDKYVMKMF